MWIQPGVGLAHRRLAIIDLSRRAAQPMTTSDGRYTIVFNGEIYNYQALRDQLSADWKSSSDTEVLLEGYRAWGVDVFKRLRGMFAIALWDAQEKKLLLARDPVGKKPLFYHVTSKGDLFFASEIKALRAVMSFEPDEQAMRLFLGLQYVPSPHTGFKDIKQLEPGCSARWTAHEGLHVDLYHAWSTERLTLDQKTIDETLRTKLDEAVKIRQLASDVPVGAFLSGGIDSAAVVALATRHLDRPIQTFTMGFASRHMDERPQAEDLARLFKTDHMSFEAKPNDLLDLLDVLVTHYDAPYADSSALPLWLLARETAQNIKVVLTGDGGDEVFGGYRRYVYFSHAQNICRVPGAPTIGSPMLRLTGRMSHDTRFTRIADAFDASSCEPRKLYAEIFCGAYFGHRRVRSLCSSDFLIQTETSDATDFIVQHMTGDAVDDAMRFDLTSYLPDDLNVKMDRATMAFGLEARCPLLDQEVVHFALGLPLNQKVSHGKTKIALKRALRGILPASVLGRRKRGFQVPLAEWFRGPLAPLIKQRCLDPQGPLAGRCRLETIQSLVDENQRGADHGNRLWMLLTLSTWLSNMR